MQTWADHVIEIMNDYPYGVTSVDIAAATGLKVKRAAGLLGKMAMYGLIKRISPYHHDYRPEYRTLAVYCKLDHTP
jgi:hypothetical protein